MTISRSMKTLAVLVLLLALFASITVARGGGSRRCASRAQKKAFKRAAKAGNGEGMNMCVMCWMYTHIVRALGVLEAMKRDVSH